MKNSLFVLVAISLIILFNSCDTQLNEYQTKNENEKQIIAVLNTYLDARNSGNLNNLQATFHDDGVYISGRGREIKASEIVNTKPEWWTSDGEVKLYDPEITINGNEATVMTTARYGTYKTAHIYTLINENGNWLIMKVY